MSLPYPHAPAITPGVALPDAVLALYRHVHATSAVSPPAGTAAQLVTVLHLGAEHTIVAAGAGPREPSMVATLALGYDKTARDFFRRSVPTPLELETAIASVEDEIHAAHRRQCSDASQSLPYDQALVDAAPAPWSADPGLHALATLAGVPAGPVRLLPLDAMERLFNRLAAVSEGRPAAHEGLPDSAAFAARLLVLRELMHHMPFAAITLVEGPVS
ncbi:hypothetical protein ASF11_23560 [Acidovorax sp. Leaf76]|uniref:hypothetical protein n=1 Tax=unclassified Acidovorax TaxID=2684926 RepID=UPI0006FE2AD8|nr:MULTISPECIES: hypothetical protein [unclassified Acidovorax]KQO23743.1 hypothetical protein ASF11_23560 [Acidovorax sp. Leaf76]KQO35558.1 hypothetical protein ASF19_23630 [Acidovorax sp. Leaf84]KQS37884.1 hypothetical protein ASG27_23885 [Acidovorax sp. Leaf191]